MPVRVSDKEIKKLSRRNRRVVHSLKNDFIKRINFNDPGSRIFSAPEKALSILENRNKVWAERNIKKTYQAAVRSVEKRLNGLGKLSKNGDGFKGHDEAVEVLINDADVGFMSGVLRSTNELKNRVELIKNQVGSISGQKDTISSSISKLGLFTPENIDLLKSSVVEDLNSVSSVSEKAFTYEDPLSLIYNISHIGDVTFSNGRGGKRHVRLDKHVESLGRIKAAQAITSATRNTLLGHGHDLVQVKSFKPKKGSFCDMYNRKVFALTEEASKRWGVPHVSMLPNRGAPFHPNCSHTEAPYFPDRVSKKVNKKNMFPVPDWALGQSVRDIRSAYTVKNKSSRAKIKKRQSNARLLKR